jgi:hypothetical protein
LKEVNAMTNAEKNRQEIAEKEKKAMEMAKEMVQLPEHVLFGIDLAIKMARMLNQESRPA